MREPAQSPDPADAPVTGAPAERRRLRCNYCGAESPSDPVMRDAWLVWHRHLDAAGNVIDAVPETLPLSQGGAS